MEAPQTEAENPGLGRLEKDGGENDLRAVEEVGERDDLAGLPFCLYKKEARGKVVATTP